MHKETIAGASAADEREAEVVAFGTLGPRQCAIDKLIRKRQAKGQPLHLVSEAGPCGAWWYRDLSKKKRTCWGVAPSCIPKKASARGKTDRRDARHLARLLRSGALPPGYMPRGEEEAIRAVGRAREEGLTDLKAAKGRLKACLLRQDMRDEGRANWTAAHLRGVAAGVCPPPAPQLVCQEYVGAVAEQTDRLQRVAADLPPLGQTWRWAPVMEAIQALRGSQFTTAVPLSAELGALTRFATPRQLMSSLGLVPREPSSGERRRQGSSTKTGNSHARRVLVEGAWAYRSPAKGRRHLHLRLEKVPPGIQDISCKAPGRLCQRSRRLGARGNQGNQVVGARARAMAAFVGARAREVAVAH